MAHVFDLSQSDGNIPGGGVSIYARDPFQLTSGFTALPDGFWQPRLSYDPYFPHFYNEQGLEFQGANWRFDKSGDGYLDSIQYAAGIIDWRGELGDWSGGPFWSYVRPVHLLPLSEVGLRRMPEWFRDDFVNWTGEHNYVLAEFFDKNGKDFHLIEITGLTALDRRYHSGGGTYDSYDHALIGVFEEYERIMTRVKMLQEQNFRKALSEIPQMISEYRSEPYGKPLHLKTIYTPDRDTEVLLGDFLSLDDNANPQQVGVRALGEVFGITETVRIILTDRADHISGMSGMQIGQLEIIVGAGDDSITFTEIVGKTITPRRLVIDAGPGNDRVEAVINEATTLFGGAGNDWLRVNDYGRANLVPEGGPKAIVTMHGGAGNDFLKGALTHARNVLDGGPGHDSLFGGRWSDTLRGGAGNDSIYGVWEGATREGDALYGDRGNDHLFGTGQADTLDGGAGNDLAQAGAGDDLMRGGAGRDTLRGEAGSDTLDGGAGNDRLLASAGDDSLAGGGGDDLLDGGPGSDTLWGGPGADTLKGGGGADNFVFLHHNEIGTAGEAVLGFSGAEDTLDFSGMRSARRFVGDGPLQRPGDVAYDARAKLLSGDVDGDGVADWSLKLTLARGTTLDADNFLF